MGERKNLDFEAVAFIGDGIGYASSFENNGLFEINVYNEKCRYLMLFPNEEPNGIRIYISAVYCNENVYFIPMSGEYISIFNVNTKMITQLNIPVPKRQCTFYKSKFKFCKGIYNEGYLYLIPFTYPGILKINIKTNEIFVIDNWITDEEYFFRGGVCVDGSKILASSGTGNMILEFNISTEKVILHHIGMYNNGAASICKYNENYVIAPRLEGSVVIWNSNTDEYQEIVEYPEGFSAKKIWFSEIIQCGHELFLMPASANTVITFDNDMKKLVIEDMWKPKDNCAMVACMFETSEYYYFRESSNCECSFRRYKIRKKDGKTESYEFVVENDEEYKKAIFDDCVKSSETMTENESFNIKNYLKLL